MYSQEDGKKDGQWQEAAVLRKHGTESWSVSRTSGESEWERDEDDVRWATWDRCEGRG